MERYQDVVIDSNLKPVSGASVLVRPAAVTTITSTIYGTSTGTSTRANPLTTDTNGRFWFYGTNSRYDLIVSGSYINTTTLSDVMLEDVPLSNLAELSTASSARDNLSLTAVATSTVGRFLQTSSNLSELTGTAAKTALNNLRRAVVALASTGQIVPDFSTGVNFSLAMTVNTTLAAGTGGTASQEGRIVITQNSTAKTLAYDSAFYKFAAGATATLSTATSVGTRDVLKYYIMDSTSAECEMRNLVS